MNFDENTTKYSAFAIIAIESVWPNPEGNEAPPDVGDLELIGIEPENVSRSGVARQTYQSSQFSNSEDDYQRQNGYYKILPLNVLRVDTTSQLQGSQFAISFTLDDLLLVADKNADFLNATGLPFKTQDMIDLGSSNTLPMLLGEESKKTWDYITDEELGLTRYRVSGDSSQFNIEDLVEPNDTVTIWLYHDPADFYIKDDIPRLNEETLQINDEISTVVGSADRRSQYADATQSYDDYILSTLGLLDKFTGKAIEATIDSSSNIVQPDAPPFSFGDASLSREDVLDAVVTFGIEATQTKGFNLTTLDDFENFVESFDENLTKESAAYQYLIKPYVLPSGTTREDVEEEITVNEVNRLEAISKRELIIETARQLWDDEQKIFTPEKAVDVEGPNLTENVETYREVQRDNNAVLEELAVGLQQFKLILEGKLRDYIDKYLEGNKSYSVVDQRFSHGRQMLINDFSGETPYLALKGKISTINVNVGHQTGSYTVTLTGQGYEKTLKEHEVFYEDIFYVESAIIPQAEYNTLYLNVSPPRVMLDVVNRYASRNLIFKNVDRKSALSDENVQSQFSDDLAYITVSEQHELFGNQQVVARGNYVYKEYKTDITREDVRVFYPVNFLETTRVYEMVRSLDLSFEQEESIYRNTRTLRGRTSVFQNLRMLGGTEQLYEMFVDETGRLRYRFTFEAYERTPNLAITPLIDDTLLLPGANFAVTDSSLSTLVDVVPASGVQSDGSSAILNFGRALPEVGSVPINNLSLGDDNQSVDVDDLVAPDFFRYGLQTLQIEDVYTSPAKSSKRKAQLYYNVFGEPLKNARLSLLNNTSYRVGNTALVALQKNKHRSKTLINIEKFLNWLKYIKDNDSEITPFIDMYIGIDERLINKSAYAPTSGDYEPIPGGFYSNYETVEDAKRFVLDQFIATFEFLKDEIGLSVITPEFFPNTFWYYASDADGGEDFIGEEGRISSSKIKEFYTKVLNSAVNNSRRDFVDNATAPEARLKNAARDAKEPLNREDEELIRLDSIESEDGLSEGEALDAEGRIVYSRLVNDDRLVALLQESGSVETYGFTVNTSPVEQINNALESANYNTALQLANASYERLKYNRTLTGEGPSSSGLIENNPDFVEADKNLERLSQNKQKAYNAYVAVRNKVDGFEKEIASLEETNEENQETLEQTLKELESIRQEIANLEDEIGNSEPTEAQSLKLSNLEVEKEFLLNNVTQNEVAIEENEQKIKDIDLDELIPAKQELNQAEISLRNAQNALDEAVSEVRKYRGGEDVPVYSDTDLAPLTSFISRLEDLVNQQNFVQNVERETSEASIANDLSENPGIINTLKFQDFRAASYYIQSVSHKFEHGKAAVTNLQLNYGQDNLLLLEPKNNIPIGFISIEKNLRIGYDSTEEKNMFNADGSLSSEQKLYFEQFKQDKNYLKGSLLYQAQKLRNSSNYMRNLALIDNVDVSNPPRVRNILNETTRDSTTLNVYSATLSNLSVFDREAEGAESVIDTRGASERFYRLAYPIILELEEKYPNVPQETFDSIVSNVERDFQEVTAGLGGEESIQYIRYQFNEEFKDLELTEPFPDEICPVISDVNDPQKQPKAPNTTEEIPQVINVEGSFDEIYPGTRPVPNIVKIVNIVDRNYKPKSQGERVFDVNSTNDFTSPTSFRYAAAQYAQDNYVKRLPISKAESVSKEQIINTLQDVTRIRNGNVNEQVEIVKTYVLTYYDRNKENNTEEPVQPVEEAEEEDKENVFDVNQTTVTSEKTSFTANGDDFTIITVQLKDKNGNDITLSGGTLTFIQNPNLGVVSNIVDNQNGTYTAKYTAGTSLGTTRITAVVNGIPLENQLSFTFNPGEVAVNQSTIEADKTTLTADGSDFALITVQLKDENGNNVSTSGGTLIQTPELGTFSEITQSENGVYTAKYVAGTEVGTSEVTAKFGGFEFQNTLSFTFEAGAADLNQSTLTSGITTLNADGSDSTVLTVQLVDVNGNNLTTGGANVTFTDSQELGVFSSVTDNGDGTYNVTYTSGTTSGQTEVTAFLDGNALQNTLSFTLQAQTINRIIRIDAGHGGDEPGTVFEDKVEKDYNLAYALEVASALRAAGYTVEETRTTDVKVVDNEGSQQIRSSDLSENDIFISIHHDFPGGKDLILYPVGNLTTPEISSSSLQLAQAVDNYFGSNDIRARDPEETPTGVFTNPALALILIEVDNIADATLDPTAISNFASHVVNGVNDFLNSLE